MFAVASSWNMYSLPVRFARSPVHRSFDSTPNVTPLARRISNSDRSDFWKSASNAPAQPEPHEVLVPRPDRTSRGRPTPRTSAAGRSPGPRCCRAARGGCRPRRESPGASPFDTSPRRAPMISGRCSMPTGHWFSQAPQVVHCHSTLGVEDLASFVSRFPASSASCVCRIERLRVQLLARAAGRAVHLAAAALDARERVEHLLALARPSPSRGRPAPSRNRGSARLPSSGDLRNTVIGDSTQVEVLRCRDQRQEREDHDRVHPPVHAARRRRARGGTSSRNVTISVMMKHADDDRLDRTRVAERRRPDERAPDQQPIMPTSDGDANGASAIA